MTRQEIISKVDRLQNNNFEDDVKMSWLVELEKKIVDEQFKNHEILCDKKIDTENDTELYAPIQFYDIYKNYLLTKYALYSGEYERANIFETRFWSVYQELCNYINRTYKPLQNNKIEVS